MPLSRVPSSFTNATRISSPSANTIRFTTASATRGQFDSQGNFTVGSFTAPQNTVVRNWTTGDYTRVGQSGSFNLNLYYSTSNSRWEYAGTGHGAVFVDNGSGSFSISTTGSSGTLGQEATTLSRKIFFDSDGLVNIPFGQIKFPASQNASADANTLDDYEEGTWTPVNTQGVGMSISVSQYQKIGNQVFLNAFCNINSNSNPNDLIITGLPFAMTSGSSSVGCFNNNNENLYTYWDGNGIYIRTSGNVNKTLSQLSNRFVAFQLYYRTTTG